MENNIQTFQINRDGQPDPEWLTQQRIASMQRLGEQTVKIIGSASLTVGKGIVWLFTHETARQTTL